MKRNPIIELMELAVSLADAELDGRDVAHILVGIVQEAVQAYDERTGEALALNRCEVEIGGHHKQLKTRNSKLRSWVTTAPAVSTRRRQP